MNVGLWEEFLKVFKSVDYVDSLLEIGCADGFFLRFAKELGISYLNVPFNIYQYENALMSLGRIE